MQAGGPQQVDVASPHPVYPGLIGQQPNPAALHQVDGIGEQDVNAGPYPAGD
jgi:hypothetical protein